MKVLLLGLLAPTLVLGSISSPGSTKVPALGGYTPTSRAEGVQFSARFQKRDFPAKALVSVTVTVRNISDSSLQVTDRPGGICGAPLAFLVPVDARGHDVTPISKVPPPVAHCPFIGFTKIPIGHSRTERLFVPLWSGRLEITPSAGPRLSSKLQITATFRLHSSPAPRIRIVASRGKTAALVSPPAGARGPMYYRSWGPCRLSADLMTWFGSREWRTARGTTIYSDCHSTKSWHIEVGWLNSPVASLDYFRR